MREDNHPLDPHASKIDPDDPRLRIHRPKGRTLKKGPVIAVGCALLGLVLIAVTFALQPAVEPEGLAPGAEETPAPTQVVIPEVIRNAPVTIPEPEPPPPAAPTPRAVTAPTPDAVPPLGEPLPGDLGAAMVRPARPSAYGTARPALSPEEEARRQRLAQAMTASVFFAAGAEAQGGRYGGSSQADADPALRELLELQRERLGEPGPAAGASPSGAPLAAAGANGVARQNLQANKKAFLAGEGGREGDYLSGALREPRSPYEIKAGSIIPVVLITGVNSDLPGDIVGQVREHVFDTVTGNHLLIPQGSKLLATYDSLIAYGQDRVLVCWNRLIRPDGSSLNLECSPGVDLAGYAGFADRVDHHWGRLITGVVLSSILAATATTSQGTSYGADDRSFTQDFAANVGGNVNQVGQQITQKNLNIQPTVKIRSGFSVNVLVNKDILLPPYRG